MRINDAPWLIVPVILIVLAYILIFKPYKIVSLMGKFYKVAYKDVMGMDDDEIDSLPTLPADRWALGSRAEFIRRAADFPEDYDFLNNWIRFLGIILFLMLALTGCLLAFGWKQISSGS